MLYTEIPTNCTPLRCVQCGTWLAMHPEDFADPAKRAQVNDQHLLLCPGPTPTCARDGYVHCPCSDASGDVCCWCGQQR